ncbi:MULTISPECIES: hypothetical protein [unclassified Mesorhizobium]|uniref:hypothetical protein n=1 Tax=unclassified Mesorhizobium TaxID=325217 RepID=UPI001092870D|nr:MULTISPECIES: hypothetical protein [unclassified Mesorhizobium]TIS88275.1 MAG: hypothetical protein E5W88_23205 [Mesorhizobium sp.]TGQ01448.1 hypothetical protein EN861_01670 [Mesorhizobium sp. M8A.F.Ca.ET.218.01.1.1]TGS43799.1 hypothetical protein EN825_17355 [Mesorhizobium sp. M8A.F.Ca.ET.182.01.1.1]TGS78038.1 hypothetical protein EN824_27870 [Mesorhizobium sp. M8A.F.Ca.ET.181.01.1.1]TGT20720.1 hypothetical protein EN856_01675 [Mesorhizobium sp. M8A.F.Ca.ET.213.01.1.1]
MRIIYFHSDTHPYDKAIYPGVGPAFARPFSWEARPISQIGRGHCEVAVVDNRLEPGDVEVLKKHLAVPASDRPALFFRVSDSDMPETTNPCVRFIFDCADHPGVHYATTYDPEGPFLAFVGTLKVSRVVHLPYPYDTSREVEIPLAGRRRGVFLSGSNSRTLYPVRYALRRRRARFPWLRLFIFDLKHPGYPEHGKPPRHDFTHARYIGLAAQFSHFFLCGTRYNVELMKYVECAYAGCVPVGVPAGSLDAVAGRYFRPYGGPGLDLLKDLWQPMRELEERAAGYRAAMRELRSPARIIRDFTAEVRGIEGK